MQQKYLIFIAIILGSVIIGGFVYLAFVDNPALVQNNNAEIYLEKESSECGVAENPTVTKVIDGDTIVAEGGYHIRILGIDADEKSYKCYNQAKARLEELVLNKKVSLEREITDVDQYKRCLRNIFIGDQNVGLQLVREGLAVARFYEPDVKYKEEIISAEKQAIFNKVGCKWGR